MLHITLGPKRAVDPKRDPLGRDFVGFSPKMSARALFETNRGCWKLGPRAHRERHMLFTFNGIVQQAVEIESIVPAPRGNRSVVNGKPLRAGHPVHDRHVGKRSPVQGVRNPVTYFVDELDNRLCRCGCGGRVTVRDFLTGHDQRAIHDRISQIGTVAEFLDWFDTVRGRKKAS